MTSDAEREPTARPTEGREDVRFEARLAFAVAAILAFAFVATCHGVKEEPRWSAEYFPRQDFTGPSVRRWEHALRFDWGTGSPAPGIPEDRFSARFETCLDLPDARRVAFLLTSDDGSFLDVDGERVVELPGVHRLRSRGVEVDLGAGTHHLRVDYFEARGKALVGLSASLDGKAPRQIPGELLARPVEGRCGGERSPARRGVAQP